MRRNHVRMTIFLFCVVGWGCRFVCPRRSTVICHAVLCMIRPIPRGRRAEKHAGPNEVARIADHQLDEGLKPLPNSEQRIPIPQRLAAVRTAAAASTMKAPSAISRRDSATVRARLYPRMLTAAASLALQLGHALPAEQARSAVNQHITRTGTSSFVNKESDEPNER